MAKTFKKIILDDLKAQNLTVIASKIKSICYRSFSGGDAVDVHAIDLLKNERDSLEKILDEYEDGHFNGMTDCYEYKKDKSKKERTAKYVHLRNDFSEERTNMAIWRELSDMKE